MWILTPVQSGGETHYLISSNDYVVGRKNADIILVNDQSISRAHAHLTATDQTLTLKDASKYGTFVNSQRVTENTLVNLKPGDSVTFGAFDSKFSVDHQKTVVCSSCLDSDGKASLSQALLALGGKLVSTWTQECTHLAMPSVKVTIKTISALLCCCPIVKPEFFSELHKAVQQKLPPPKAESFVPVVDEPSLSPGDVKLGVAPVRRHLFAGKTFVFLSAKQLKRLSVAVSFGKGKSQLLEEGAVPRDLLEAAQSCVVDVSTGSSQTLLSSSTREWANTVKAAVQRKGLRVIPESEIGLAAIFASCEKYCNPSSAMSDSESVPKVNPRIPSASLSQNVAVDETLLPAASQNITAYALNTEPSEWPEPCEVTGMMAVAETPEKKRNQDASAVAAKVLAERASAQCAVAGTMSFSLSTVDKADSQRTKPETERTVSAEKTAGVRSTPKATAGPRGGAHTLPQRPSPQKSKVPGRSSPQKQPTLMNFFLPSNKKRPLDDESSPVASEPKRPSLASSAGGTRAPTRSVTREETQSCSAAPPAAAPQTLLGSGADLFAGQPRAGAPHGVQERPPSRKRKEPEAEIGMEELESLMSEDMDLFDDQCSVNQGPKAPLTGRGSAAEGQGAGTAEPLSLSKRQRTHGVDSGANRGPRLAEQRRLAVKTEPVHPPGSETANPDSSEPPGPSSASKSANRHTSGCDAASFIEDDDLLRGEKDEPKEDTKSPLKPVMIKQEIQESKVDDNLPKKLVFVEFRSLTVSAPPVTRPKQMLSNVYAKNFKCFRKSKILGSESSAHTIGGSDLLVHNRGTNSDLDEWLKDAAEDERQSRRDETVGDDLFRYNPTKLTRRR